MLFTLLDFFDSQVYSPSPRIWLFCFWDIAAAKNTPFPCSYTLIFEAVKGRGGGSVLQILKD